MNSLPDPSRRETPQEITAHIDRLMAEAEAMLAGPVSDHSVSQLTDLKFRLMETKEKIVELYGIAQRKVVETARAVDDSIRRYPYDSLVVALGVGVVIGRILARRGAHRD